MKHLHKTALLYTAICCSLLTLNHTASADPVKDAITKPVTADAATDKQPSAPQTSPMSKKSITTKVVDSAKKTMATAKPAITQTFAAKKQAVAMDTDSDADDKDLFASTYAGIQYSFSNVDLSNAAGNSDLDLESATLQLGLHFTEWLASEIRIGFGTNSDSDGALDIDITDTYGAYLLASLPSIKPVSPYVLLGVSRFNFDITGSNTKDDRTDFSYGLGFNFEFNKKFTASLEYINYIDEGNMDIDGINLGMKYYF